MSWSRAFAKQALSDFEARQVLTGSGSLPRCHELHFLQMGMEKLAKAHLIESGSSKPEDVQRSHGYIAKHIPRIVEEHFRRNGSRIQPWLLSEVKRLAARIELLHPQMDSNGSVPANCEYPWVDAMGHIVAPAEHSFSDVGTAKEAAGGRLIKMCIARAKEIVELDSRST